MVCLKYSGEATVTCVLDNGVFRHEARLLGGAGGGQVMLTRAELGCMIELREGQN